MPCLSGTYNPSVGIIVQVAIVPGGHLNQLLAQSQSPGVTPVNVATVGGLVDTGADATCISPALVKQVGLKPLGKIQSVGVTGSGPMNQYSVDLLLQFGANAIGTGNLVVSEYTFHSPNFDVLIGRDIICNGILTMDFNGHFTFSV